MQFPIFLVPTLADQPMPDLFNVVSSAFVKEIAQAAGALAVCCLVTLVITFPILFWLKHSRKWPFSKPNPRMSRRSIDIRVVRQFSLRRLLIAILFLGAFVGLNMPPVVHNNTSWGWPLHFVQKPHFISVAPSEFQSQFLLGIAFDVIFVLVVTFLLLFLRVSRPLTPTGTEPSSPAGP